MCIRMTSSCLEGPSFLANQKSGNTCNLVASIFTWLQVHGLFHSFLPSWYARFIIKMMFKFMKQKFLNCLGFIFHLLFSSKNLGVDKIEFVYCANIQIKIVSSFEYGASNKKFLLYEQEYPHYSHELCTYMFLIRY